MRAWSLENVLLSYYYRNHKMIIICSLRKSRGGSQSSQGSVPFSSATPLSAKKLGNQFFNVWLRHEAVIENPWIDRSWMLSSWIIILPLDLEILHSKNQLKNGSTFQLTPYYRNWPWKVNIWIIKRVTEITLINTWSLSVLCLRLY